MGVSTELVPAARFSARAGTVSESHAALFRQIGMQGCVALTGQLHANDDAFLEPTVLADFVLLQFA